MRAGAGIFAAVVVAGLNASVQAAFLAPADWASGWARGSGTTTYQEWDVLGSAGGPNNPNSPGNPAAADVAATAYNPNGTASLFAVSPGAEGVILTGGGNLYGFGGVAHFEATVPDYTLGAGSMTTAVVQIRVTGTELDYGSFRLDGVEPTYAGFLSKTVESIGFGDSVNAELWLLFELAGSDESLDLTFASAAAHTSLDKVSIDTITSAGAVNVQWQGTPVPEPTMLGALGIAGGGLLLRRRGR